MLKNMCCSAQARNFGLLALRVTVGAIFIYQGWSKFGNMEMFSGMLDGAGYPIPGFFAWLTAIIELFAGLAVLLGVFTRNAAALLAAVMLVALLTIHIGQQPFNEWFLPFALLGSTLGLSGVGGGAWSLMKDECMMHKK